MTSAERKAAEASAPPVQTGYFDPNNPGEYYCFHNSTVLNMVPMYIALFDISI